MAESHDSQIKNVIVPIVITVFAVMAGWVACHLPKGTANPNPHKSVIYKATYKINE